MAVLAFLALSAAAVSRAADPDPCAFPAVPELGQSLAPAPHPVQAVEPQADAAPCSSVQAGLRQVEPMGDESWALGGDCVVVDGYCSS